MSPACSRAGSGPPGCDTSLISVAVRLVRAVEGAVDVDPQLTGESAAPAGPGAEPASE